MKYINDCEALRRERGRDASVRKRLLLVFFVYERGGGRGR